MVIQDVLERFLGSDLPVRVEAYDGSVFGDLDSATVVRVVSPAAMHRIITGRGSELAFARAYVAGEVDIDGDIYQALQLRERVSVPRLSPTVVRELLAAVGVDDVRSALALRPPPRPPEEVHLRGLRHSKARDAAAISAHYDVSNDFYRLVLGPTMTYSCAVFDRDDDPLDAAQLAKVDLICRKLGIRPGMRLLDIGCGWGTLVMHAARHYGAHAVGITISQAQVELAEKRIAEAGLTGRAEVRYCDYREVHDGPFDVISSVGMFEHVGLRRLQEYFEQAHRLLRPGGRFLNHAISRPAGAASTRLARNGFVNRYVFPDGELHEVGAVVSAMQGAGFEARHLETLREHYALTLRRWVANLEANWDRAIEETSEARARIWRLYMAGSAMMFEAGELQVHQVLGTRSTGGHSAMPLRPDW